MGIFDFLKTKETDEGEDEVELAYKGDSKINLHNKKEEIIMDTNLKYTIIRPTDIRDAQQILNLVKDRIMVTFSIERLSKEEGQRTVDLVSGATHAMSGKTLKITDKVFTSIPAGIEISNLIEEKEEN